MIHLLVILLVGFQSTNEPVNVGLFPKALWFIQNFGHKDCAFAKNDRTVKTDLAKALATDRELSLEDIPQLMSPEVFHRFAGDDARIDETEITNALKSSAPTSRDSILPDLRNHAEFLTTTYDMIESDHLPAIEQLSDWIANNYKTDSTTHVVITCTGNSRRSILGASMANLAATYYGFENMRFHSGGTTPSAFNKRTIATLKEIGFQIQPTGNEAARGDPKVPNPIHRVIWGDSLETTEFSKTYNDASNPQSGFAAIMVCTEADAECPTIPGASVRISMTFLDPKSYDDGLLENKKYAERRDDIGRTFLAIMVSARRKMLDGGLTK